MIIVTTLHSLLYGRTKQAASVYVFAAGAHPISSHGWMNASYAGSTETDHLNLFARCLHAKLRAISLGYAYSPFSISPLCILRARFPDNSVIRTSVFCISATRTAFRELQNITAPLFVKHRDPHRAFFLKTV